MEERPLGAQVSKCNIDGVSVADDEWGLPELTFEISNPTDGVLTKLEVVIGGRTVYSDIRQGVAPGSASYVKLPVPLVTGSARVVSVLTDEGYKRIEPKSSEFECRNANWTNLMGGTLNIEVRTGLSYISPRKPKLVFVVGEREIYLSAEDDLSNDFKLLSFRLTASQLCEDFKVVGGTVYKSRDWERWQRNISKYNQEMAKWQLKHPPPPRPRRTGQGSVVNGDDEFNLENLKLQEEEERRHTGNLQFLPDQ